MILHDAFCRDLWSRSGELTGFPKAEVLMELGSRLAGVDNAGALEVCALLEGLPEKDDSLVKVRTLGIRAETAYYGPDAAAFLALSFEVEALAKIHSDHEALADTLVKRAQMGLERGDPVQAIELLDQAVELLTPHQSDLGRWGRQAMAYAESGRATVLFVQGNVAEAYAATLRSLTWFRSLPGHQGIFTPFLGLLWLGMELGSITEAVRLGMDVVEEFRRADADSRSAPILESFTWFLEQLKNGPGENEEEFQKAMEGRFRRFAPTPAAQVYTRSNLGRSYLRTHKYLELKNLTDDLLALPQLDQARGLLPQVHHLRVEAFRGLGDAVGEVGALRELMHWEKILGAEQAQQKVEFNKMLREVEFQTQEAERERQRQRELAALNAQIDGLLANVLPGPVIDELKAKGTFEPRQFERATILVGDLVGFSTASRDVPAPEVFAELNELYARLDGFAISLGLARLKTIGDAYMVVAGLFDQLPDPVASLLEFATQASRAAATHGQRFRALRWGLAQGPVMAGIVGTDRFAFDVFGHTVNVAFRLEAAGKAQHLNLPAHVAEGLSGERTNLLLKGVGEMDAVLVPLTVSAS